MSHEEQVKDAERSMELLGTCRRRRFNKGRRHSARETESLRSAPPKVADGGRVQTENIRSHVSAMYLIEGSPPLSFAGLLKLTAHRVDGFDGRTEDRC